MLCHCLNQQHVNEFHNSHQITKLLKLSLNILSVNVLGQCFSQRDYCLGQLAVLTWQVVIVAVRLIADKNAFQDVRRAFSYTVVNNIVPNLRELLFLLTFETS